MFNRAKTYLAGMVTGLALAVAVPLLAQVGGSDLPHTFTAGTPAHADEVNANFEALASRNAALESRVANLETANAELTSRLEELEVFIADLRTHLSVTNDARGNPAIVVSGANLQVNNGTGDTDTVNGTGNVVIGYDETRASGTGYDPECSYGSYTNQSQCVDNGFAWAVNHKSGSHNLVIGTLHNYSRYGGLVVGEANSITGRFASVSGGRRNRATRPNASVSGGWQNTASHLFASVSGGRRNTASGEYASISGGFDNFAASIATHVSGGRDNAALGDYSAVVGGEGNSTNGDYSVVAGGDSNVASGSHAIAP